MLEVASLASNTTLVEHSLRSFRLKNCVARKLVSSSGRQLPRPSRQRASLQRALRNIETSSADGVRAGRIVTVYSSSVQVGRYTRHRSVLKRGNVHHIVVQCHFLSPSVSVGVCSSPSSGPQTQQGQRKESVPARSSFPPAKSSHAVPVNTITERGRPTGTASHAHKAGQGCAAVYVRRGRPSGPWGAPPKRRKTLVFFFFFPPTRARQGR